MGVRACCVVAAVALVALIAYIRDAAVSGRVCFSQAAQDVFVVELLGKKQGGVFVDVGASDGITNSNSFMLEWWYGWHGVCIEPGSRYPLLRWMRPSCINIGVPMSSIDREVSFLRSTRTAEHSGIAETSPWAHSTDPREGARRESVRATTLNATLARWQRTLWPEHVTAAVIHVDFLSLDTEGHEAEVLKGFPFERFALRVLCVERSTSLALVRSLLKRSTTLVHVGAIGADAVFVAPKLAHRARLLLSRGERESTPEIEASRLRIISAAPLYGTAEAMAKRMLTFLHEWR